MHSLEMSDVSDGKGSQKHGIWGLCKNRQEVHCPHFAKEEARPHWSSVPILGPLPRHGFLGHSDSFVTNMDVTIPSLIKDHPFLLHGLSL